MVWPASYDQYDYNKENNKLFQLSLTVQKSSKLEWKSEELNLNLS